MSTSIRWGLDVLQLVAINARNAATRRMPLTISPARAEQELTGQALRRLRERLKDTARGVVTLDDVGRQLGITGSGWQLYEKGSRKFKDTRVDKVLEFLEASRHDLDVEKARVLAGEAPRSGAHGAHRPDFVFEVYGRARIGPQGPEVYDIGEPLRRLDLRQMLGVHTAAMEIVGDSMIPWGEPGEVVLFDRDRYPRRGSGCVIETKAGEAYVKFYEKSDGSTLFVRELFPNERMIQFRLEDIKGVYAVRLRGD